jgi:hypothetical protein
VPQNYPLIFSDFIHAFKFKLAIETYLKKGFLCKSFLQKSTFPRREELETDNVTPLPTPVRRETTLHA